MFSKPDFKCGPGSMCVRFKKGLSDEQHHHLIVGWARKLDEPVKISQTPAATLQPVKTLSIPQAGFSRDGTRFELA